MRNPYFDLLGAGQEVLVSNQHDFWGDPGFRKLSLYERLYFQEQHGVIIEFKEASRPRYRAYNVRLDDGSIIQRNVGSVRLPSETYGHDGSHRELSDMLAALATASMRPDRPWASQPGTEDVMYRVPSRGGFK